MRYLAILIAFASFAAAAQPTEITAEYEVSSSGVIIGRINETFVRKADTYTIQSVMRSEGLLKAIVDDEFTVESAGRVGASGLKPLRYGERRAKDSKRDLKSTFDWEKRVMRTLARGEKSEVALPVDTQDRISLMYQFMNLPAYGESFVIPMADRRKIETHTYRLVEEVKLTTPAGDFDTRHYQRVVNNPKDTRADVWLARDRFNFPVRLVLDDPKGFKLDQSLVALQAR
jgi:uncharacterized protein DUF3108